MTTPDITTPGSTPPDSTRTHTQPREEHMSPTTRAARRVTGLVAGAMLCATGISLSAPAPAHAEDPFTLSFGDIVVGDGGDGVSYNATVNRIDSDGTKTLLASPDAVFDVATLPDAGFLVSQYYLRTVLEYPADGSGPLTTLSLAKPSRPHGLAVEPDGDLLVVDTNNSRLLRVDATGTSTVIATDLLSPTSVAVGPDGAAYVTDTLNNRLVKVADDGTETVVSTDLSEPYGVAVDTDGTAFVTDLGNNRVVAIEPNGDQSTISTSQSYPNGIAIEADGHLLVGDTSNQQLTRMNRDGSEQTVITNDFGVIQGIDSYAPAPTLAEPDLGSAQVGSDYRYQFEAAYDSSIAGTTPTPEVKLYSGTLPTGLSLDPETGVLSGTPTESGTFTFEVAGANEANFSEPQEVTLEVQETRAPQSITFTSTPPSDAVAGDTYAVSATGGDSGNPVTFDITSDSADVCSVTGSLVTALAEGTCTVTADQAGDTDYANAPTQEQNFEVTKAGSTTEAGIAAETLTADVTATDTGTAITPTGYVTFLVDGVDSGSAQLDDGTATLHYEVPTGEPVEVTARYLGSDAFLASQDVVDRTDPTISATLTSPKPRSASGWYRTPVKVTFTCTAGTGAVESCPDPVTLRTDGADQTVTGSVSASDGGLGSATIDDIDIDRHGPKVHVRGVQPGHTYPAVQHVRCKAKDATSGVKTCTIKTHRSAQGGGVVKISYVATAHDRAGNRTQQRGYYLVR